MTEKHYHEQKRLIYLVTERLELMKALIILRHPDTELRQWYLTHLEEILKLNQDVDNLLESKRCTTKTTL